MDDRGAVDDARTLVGLDRGPASGDCDGAVADRHSASLDGLTGAYLRRPGLLQLERDLGRARRNGEPLVVASLTSMGSRPLNDQSGHAAGDRLLHHVARTLQTQLRPQDLIIRFGGDEFVCVVAGLGQDDVARRLVRADTVSLTDPHRVRSPSGWRSSDPATPPTT